MRIINSFCHFIEKSIIKQNKFKFPAFIFWQEFYVKNGKFISYIFTTVYFIDIGIYISQFHKGSLIY